MLLVTREVVGPRDYARMVRAGILAPLTPTAALPADLSPTPQWRARAVRDLVPAHTVLSGLGGLWVHEGGQCPDHLTVVGRRGLHRTVAPDASTGPTPMFHSGSAVTELAATIEGIRVATPARCAVDALRWDDHRRALPLVARSLRARRIDASEIRRIMASDSAVGAGYSRMKSAWQALSDATT